MCDALTFLFSPLPAGQLPSAGAPPQKTISAKAGIQKCKRRATATAGLHSILMSDLRVYPVAVSHKIKRFGSEAGKTDGKEVSTNACRYRWFLSFLHPFIFRLICFHKGLHNDWHRTDLSSIRFRFHRRWFISCIKPWLYISGLLLQAFRFFFPRLLCHVSLVSYNQPVDTWDRPEVSMEHSHCMLSGLNSDILSVPT